MRLKLVFLCKVWYNVFTKFIKECSLMGNTTNKKTYEKEIQELCFKASTLPISNEGARDEEGFPTGMTSYAIAAKILWIFQRDSIEPLSQEEAKNPNRIFEEFYKHYKPVNKEPLSLKDYEFLG